jgi:hypothetical protein
MLIIENILVSEELFEQKFACHLEKCKGACCKEGSSGAPLEKGEVRIIRELLPQITPYMQAESLQWVDTKGFHETDADGDEVTVCRPDGECVFVRYNELGQLQCAIQEAYKKDDTGFEKPISCHLYPIRVSKTARVTALHYHRWDICADACNLGEALQLPVFRFLEQPLKRYLGVDWFQELEEVAAVYSASNNEGK